MNENYAHPAMPEGAREGILRGMYLLRDGGRGQGAAARAAARLRRDPARGDRRGGAAARRTAASRADVWSCPSFNELRRDGLEAERWNLLHPAEEPRVPYVEQCLAGAPRARSSRRPTTCAPSPTRSARSCRAATRCSAPTASAAATRASNLRRFFEVDRHYVAVAALKALADDGEIPAAKVAEAIEKYGIDPEKPAPGRCEPGVDGAASATAHRRQGSKQRVGSIEVRVPDIGDFEDVAVIEVLVKPGDAVEAGRLADHARERQGDDGGARRPSPGVVTELRVSVGDKVCEGALIADARGAGEARRRGGGAAAHSPRRRAPARRRHQAAARRRPSAPTPPAAAEARAAAAPARRAADRRRLRTASLPTRARRAALRARARRRSRARVTGSGPKGRILKEDVQGFVKQALAGGARRAPRAAPAAASAISGCPPGPRSTSRSSARSRSKPLSRIQKISGARARAQLGDDPARHAARRGRHHRARGLPQRRSTRRREGAGVKLTLLAVPA